MANATTSPRLARFDNDRRRRLGIARIGGIDEAGRGPLAGPVVAACVVLAPGTRLSGLDDSKKLTPEAREELAPAILKRALGWGIGLANNGEIDRINILRATHLAAGRAMAMLAASCAPDCGAEHWITDFLKIEGAACPVEAIVDGDARSQAVAAASILAKVARDRIMRLLDVDYPMYGFVRHKGYGTDEHWAALRVHGPSEMHRLTYRGVCAEPFFGAEGTPVLLRRENRIALTVERAHEELHFTSHWKLLIAGEPVYANPAAGGRGQASFCDVGMQQG